MDAASVCASKGSGYRAIGATNESSWSGEILVAAPWGAADAGAVDAGVVEGAALFFGGDAAGWLDCAAARCSRLSLKLIKIAARHTRTPETLLPGRCGLGFIAIFSRIHPDRTGGRLLVASYYGVRADLEHAGRRKALRHARGGVTTLDAVRRLRTLFTESQRQQLHFVRRCIGAPPWT